MLTIHAEPPLRDPILLCGFTGWSDAAFAASTALHYLAAQHDTQPIAQFDADQVFSYTVTRPITSFAAPGKRALRWPELVFTALRVPEEPHDLVLLTGPEPDLRWHACATEAVAFASSLNITQVLALGAFYAAVPYSGSPVMIGLSSNPGQRVRLTMAGIGETAYEGPTGFLTAIVDAAHRRGMSSTAVWTAAPSYLPGTNNPKLAATLLAVAERLLGQKFERSELETAGREMERQITEALRGRPDLAEFIQRLGGGGEQAAQPPSQELDEAQMTGESEELPSAEELLRDLEEHLRRERGQSPED